MSSDISDLTEKIHKVLPQTQCQMCSYQDCRAYADAISKDNASIDLCAPGGDHVLDQLAKITKQNPEPMREKVRTQHRPPQVMLIRQNECIGCTKCIQACPVDAIIGSGKLRHDILTDVCTGCELCIEPCPVDCIDIIPLDVDESLFQAQHKQQWLQRYNRREQRLNQPQVEFDQSTEYGSPEEKKQRRQEEIKRALARVQQKARS